MEQESSAARPVALVTGGGTGVGRACVLQLAARGLDVIVNFSRSQSDADKTLADAVALGAQGQTICCDVSDDLAVRKMIDEIDERFGRIDVVINNAATTEFIDHSDLESLTEEEWDRVLAVNLKRAFFVIRAAAKLLKAGEGGSVINISSVAGFTGNGSSIAYCASKAGLNSMTKSLARSLAPEIRVNAVCPGPIDSRWIPQGAPHIDLDQMVAGYPIPKPSQPNDIADAVVFFALGTKMATGQLLSVDGGQTLV